MDHSHLVGTNFIMAILDYTDLTGCDVRGMNICGAKIHNVNWNESRTDGMTTLEHLKHRGAVRIAPSE